MAKNSAVTDEHIFVDLSLDHATDLPVDLTTDLTIDQTLFKNLIDGMIVSIYENERPLAGLAGWLDWRFRGIFSSFIKNHFITGKAGECAYLPITQDHQTFHFILVGAGNSIKPGKREMLPTESISALKKNLTSLHLQKLGISKSEFEDRAFNQLTQALKGIPLWIIP